jgi:hypothetical protein
MYHTIAVETCENCLGTVALLVSAAKITRSARVRNRLEACSLTNLEVFDLIADFDNDAGAFMASTYRSLLGHRTQAPVVHHKVEIAVADTGGVQLDEHILWT